MVPYAPRRPYGVRIKITGSGSRAPARYTSVSRSAPSGARTGASRSTVTSRVSGGPILSMAANVRLERVTSDLRYFLVACVCVLGRLRLRRLGREPAGGLGLDEGGDPVVQLVDSVEAAVAARDDND